MVPGCSNFGDMIRESVKVGDFPVASMAMVSTAMFRGVSHDVPIFVSWYPPVYHHIYPTNYIPMFNAWITIFIYFHYRHVPFIDNLHFQHGDVS